MKKVLNSLSHKKIVVGISGGIAAYKSAQLVRELVCAGAEVRVVMTQAAKQFITPTTLQALSRHPVHHDLWDEQMEAAMGHIELARWADHIVIAPASADLFSRLAHGQANDLLTTLCLATTAPLLVAPAMNKQMWLHPATQANVAVLRERGVVFCGPAEGEQACGEVGPGRMNEPADIVARLSELQTASIASHVLKGKKVLITAGPTQEAIDPIRYLSNFSSGKMGYALAAAARGAGAEVVLISGPVHLDPPAGCRLLKIVTAQEMFNAVSEQLTTFKPNIFIASAAVADYRPVNVSANKRKKTGARISLELQENPDIVASVARPAKGLFIVGFAAETEKLEENAKNKLISKKLDLIFANPIGKAGQGIASDYNSATALWANRRPGLKTVRIQQKVWPKQTKSQLAVEMIQLIAELVLKRYDKKHSA